MDKYTTTIMEMIENNVVIFDFDYPFYNEDIKPNFEQLFIDYFYFDEIGVETVSRFKHLLKNKLNLIMPYWNKIFLSSELEMRILDNYSVTETFEKTTTNDNTGNNTNTNRNLYKDAPKTKVDIDNLDIVNSITKDIGNSTSINNDNGTENWTRTMNGNVGVQTDSEAVVVYWKGLRKVIQEIFEKELSQLFMGVY